MNTDYLEVNDDMLRSIMDRHRTLSFTNDSLVNRVQSMYDEVDENNLHLDELKYKHDQSILVRVHLKTKISCANPKSVNGCTNRLHLKNNGQF